MSLKGENAITTYFPRLSPNSKFKTPTQSKPKLPKRVRPDEVDLTQESSRKKSKNRNQKVTENQKSLSSTTNSSYSSFVPVQAGRPKKSRQTTVIEIQDTPPSSPIKRPASPRTPPSSPLPDLTPSPELHPPTQSPSYLPRTVDLIDEVESVLTYNASIGTSYLEHREHELEFIPSSQTQEIVTETYEEEFEVPALFSSIPIQGSKPNASPTLSYIPYSQFDIMGSSLHIDPDELIASSQSQLLDPGPNSHTTAEFDFVSSSQSQEISYSQAVVHQRPPDMREQGRSILDVCNAELPSLNCQLFNEPHDPQAQPVCSVDDDGSRLSVAPPSSQTQPESVIDEGESHLDPISSSQTQPDSVVNENGLILNSQVSARPSRHSTPQYDKEQLSPMQALWDHRCDGADSYESLPEAVKEFQGMFGETFESLPPDFPMSLRF